MKSECFYLEARVLWLLLLFILLLPSSPVLRFGQREHPLWDTAFHCHFVFLPYLLLSCSHVVLMHKMMILEWVDRGFTVCFTGKVLLTCQSLMWRHWFVVCTIISSWWHKSVGFTLWLSDSHISYYKVLHT